MRAVLMLLFFLPGMLYCNAQAVPPVTTTTEQQLENNTENTGDNETEDDGYLQLMERFAGHPVNLNEAGEAELNSLQMLTPLQVQHFFQYRARFGKLADIYELQAIPGWDPATLQKIRPYISVSDRKETLQTLRKRFVNGEYRVLLRVSQVLEKAAGYRPDSASVVNYYRGSPQRILLRFGYTFRNSLQYGIIAEKDPGEQFFRGGQKKGFDFYSAHFFARNIGRVRALALGDFTVSMGQGLIQWQGLAFKKGPDLAAIKRQSPVLRPYHSAGEINFHRGAGITLALKNWEATLFASYKKTDANGVKDSTSAEGSYVSSLQTSGYHRTAYELDDKGIQHQLVFGGNISWRYKALHIGINGIGYRFKLPLEKASEPYNLYALNGRSFSAFSADFGYTWKNMHCFGEFAVTSHLHKALVAGIFLSVSAFADLGLLYRNISKSYQFLNAAAFTENAQPGNEQGLYAGMQLRPLNNWRIDAYADLFRFPWLKYRLDAPSVGSEFFVQANYIPNKQFEFYTRYRAGAKALNQNPDQLTLSPQPLQNLQDWRTQAGFKLNAAFTVRNRVELLWFDKRGNTPENGFLALFDLLYKPPLKPFSGTVRLQYFETEGYNSRLYAYENDVLYSFSIPFFYDKGLRYYINFNYDINKKLTFWARWAQTFFFGKTLIGSGLDEIKGNKKTEARLQVMYKF